MLRQEAPHVLLISQNINRTWEERLRSGSLDFAIVAKTQFSDDYMRKNHPLTKTKNITLEQRRKYQHMAVYFPNFETTREEIKKLFASFGILSNVPFLSTNLMVCLETLSQTDMLMIGSDRLMESSLVSDNFSCKPLDDSINLRIDALSLVQHVRTEKSPLHNYLTKLIVESFKEDFET